MRSRLELCETAYGALDGCDALVIMTEWQEFQSPDFDTIKKALSESVIFDGRNLFDPQLLQTMGITYHAIGRGNANSDSAQPYGRRKTDAIESE